jgi:hypothetical protein
MLLIRSPTGHRWEQHCPYRHRRQAISFPSLFSMHDIDGQIRISGDASRFQLHGPFFPKS